LHTMRYPNRLLFIIVATTILLAAVILFIPPVQVFFGLAKVQSLFLLYCVGAAFISVVWIEILKWWNRKNSSLQ
jgi:Ca2+-transporting ATPase